MTDENKRLELPNILDFRCKSVVLLSPCWLEVKDVTVTQAALIVKLGNRKRKTWLSDSKQGEKNDLRISQLIFIFSLASGRSGMEVSPVQSITIKPKYLIGFWI